jgi:hypothetical protein
MNKYKIDYDTNVCGNTIDEHCFFLTPEYNFILFFSLPFYPISKIYKKKVLVFGHLSLALGNTVYQLHDPAKLRSSFLVARMPVEEWLFCDGVWYDWDTSSPTYRHVHLYEKAEVKRTAVFFAAIKNFPKERLMLYKRYLESIERTFQKDHFRFNRIFNNCTRVINNILYRERWLRKGPLDFVPAIAFKRLVSAWKRCDVPFCAGHFSENNPAYFRVHPVCFGLFSLSPDQNLARWIAHRGDPAKKKNAGQENSFVFPHWKHHEAGRNTKTAGM